MRSLLLLVLFAGCDAEADARFRCTKFADENPSAVQRHVSWIEECVKGRWSPKQMECHTRPGGGGFLGMFDSACN